MQVYQDCSNYEAGLTLTHFTLRSNLGKSKNYYFLETFAALGLKVAKSIQLNELMKFHEYQRVKVWSKVTEISK